GMGLTTGPDGNIWYTEGYSNPIIGRLTPAGQITEFTIPWPAAEITTGPDGNLWFEATSSSSPAIGRITPAGTVTVVAMSTGRGITPGPDGNLWISTGQPEAIRRFNTSGQVLGDFALPTGSSPFWVRPGPDGAMWFTEFGLSRIGRMTVNGILTDELA